jgi:hypothetical protein
VLAGRSGKCPNALRRIGPLRTAPVQLFARRVFTQSLATQRDRNAQRGGAEFRRPAGLLDAQSESNRSRE